MTGAAWLRRLMEREPDPQTIRDAMERRLAAKARQCAPWEARAYLESFAGDVSGRSTAARDLMVRWIGCWSQSLDAHLRLCLGGRIRQP